MKHRTGSWATICLSLVATCAFVGSASATRPNIVIMISDDAGYNNFGFAAALNGASTPMETPNLDALAQQSVVLRQGYVAAPVCASSRAGLLTGQYQQLFGFEDNIGPYNGSSPNQGLVPEQITVAQRLKDLGYSTGAIGKWHEGFLQGYNRPLDKGFDEFYGILSGGRSYWSESTSNINFSIMKNNQFYETQYRVEGDHSKYDPVKGRYVTDAWGEEAVNFIDAHADDENPFFLYLAYTAPHSPNDLSQAKTDDLAHFASIASDQQRAMAAITYAMDRSIGDVLGALNSNGIDDNTIVVFMNDNGPLSNNGDSSPMYGWKGTTFEGGIRVPFLVKGPGLQPGVYDGPVTAYDILPTFVNAAGGDASQIPTDGFDVMPLLAGVETDDPHEALFWRNWDAWAVRDGDWKLTTGITNPDGTRNNPVKLVNLATNISELTPNIAAQHRDVEALLLSKLAHWEATLAKPKWGALGALNQNTFDHFVFRADQATATNWSAAAAWRQAGTTTNATMTRGDPYANGIFEFTVRNDADYTASNDMVRISRQTFMLNQLRLTGDFNGAANHQGTLNGNALLFVKGLSGQLPQLRLDATANGTPAGFTFQLQNEVQLLDDLEITGNGTQDFVIAGRIRDFYVPTAPASVVNLITTPHNVRKTGTSKVTFAGTNTFAGTLTIEAGELAVSGAAAAIDGAASITIQAGGKLALHSGTIKTPSLIAASGSAFQFDGGTLMVTNVNGSLANTGGTLAPGMSTAISSISQDFSQTSGGLQIELGGTTAGTGFDKLMVGGSALLAGFLEVQLVNGFNPSLAQSFQILTSGGGIAGMFLDHVLPTLSGGLSWQLIYRTNGVTLTVGPAEQSTLVSPMGDYNRDGTVNGGDYTVWRNSLGSTLLLAADGNGDNLVDQDDYAVWRDHWGLAWLPLAGDYNLDGRVDMVDYTVWRNALGGTNQNADGNGDLKVDAEDFAIWKTAYGGSVNLGGSGGFGVDGVVPEPSTWLLIAIGLLAGAMMHDVKARP